MPVKNVTLSVELPLQIDYIADDLTVLPAITFVSYNGKDITDRIPSSKLREIQDDIADLADLD